MSHPVQVTTPRKRQYNDMHLASPESSRKRKVTRGAPAPNPPLAPFPTPPSSRTRRHGEADFEPEVEDDYTPKGRGKPLPAHLATLLKLHHAVNIAMSLHIATHPPVLPPHSASTTRLPLPNLTNFLAIKESVERTSGRRFGHAELSRLAWIWTWDGETLPAESSSKNAQDEDNPFLVPSTPQKEQVSGLSYLVTTTRTIDPRSGRRVHTHGLGIELELQEGETRQVLMNGATGGLGNMGQGGGVRVIGRWNSGGELREDAVRHRLERWVHLHGGEGAEPDEPSALPTPMSRDTARSTIPPIPLLSLPKLPASTGSLFQSALDASTGLTSLPKAKPIPAGLSDPFEMPDKKPVTPTGTVSERRQAMYDRVKARSESAKAARMPLSAQVAAGSAILRMSSTEQNEELKRRSTLSRLEGIAEGVWMMFSAPSPGPSSLPNAPRGRRKAIPLPEVADMIVKSSKTPISHAEAHTSLNMLTELCPFFLLSRTIARQEWLEMPASATVLAPPSPGSARAAGDEILADALSRSPGTASPRAIGRVALAGPASPGRVRRVGGLALVRERIRRELGEW